MNGSSGPSRALVVLGALAVLAAVFLAVDLRLEDPMSTRSLPAEEPYLHMAAVREHLRSGSISPLAGEDALRPAGLEAAMAAVWVYTGADLYGLFRFAPVVLGAVGVLGMGIFLFRHVGPMAAFVGSLGYAATPELVFRTTMMAAPALEFALAPFLLFTVLEVLEGRLIWGAPMGAIVLFLVFASPWSLALWAAVALLCCLAFVLVPRPSPRMASLRWGMATVWAVFSAGVVLSLLDPGGASAGTTGTFPDSWNVDWLPYVLLVVGVAPLLSLWLFPSVWSRWRLRATGRVPWWIRLASGSVIAVALLAVFLVAVRNGVMDEVNVPVVFGWPVLVLGLAGVVMLPFVAGRTAIVGASMVAVAFPLVVLQVLDPGWLVHRSPLFLAIGLVVMTGVVAHAATRWTVRAVSTSESTPVSAVVLPVALVAATMGGAVYATPSDEWQWHRLYDECQLGAIEDVADVLNQDLDAFIVVGDWQAWMVLRAFTDDPSRIMIGYWWMQDYENVHDDIMRQQAKKQAPLYVLVDPYTFEQVDDGDLAFLAAEPWQRMEAWCADQPDGSTIELHTAGVPDP